MFIIMRLVLFQVERNEDDVGDALTAAIEAKLLFNACTQIIWSALLSYFKSHQISLFRNFFLGKYTYSDNKYHANETIFIKILTTRSRPQLVLIFYEYLKLTNKTIEQTIKDEFTGEMQYGLLILGTYSKVIILFLI